MDYLRSGYTAPARWLSNGSDTIQIRWYRAAPGAQTYTLPHAFGSTVWDIPEDVASTGPGEIPDVRVYSPSISPDFPGTGFPSFPAYLLHGVPDYLDEFGCECSAIAIDGQKGVGTTGAQTLRGTVAVSGSTGPIPLSFGAIGQVAIAARKQTGELGTASHGDVAISATVLPPKATYALSSCVCSAMTANY
jgi:hypothetical protein